MRMTVVPNATGHVYGQSAATITYSTHYAGDEKVYLSFDPKKINVFDAKSEDLIKYSR